MSSNKMDMFSKIYRSLSQGKFSMAIGVITVWGMFELVSYYVKNLATHYNEFAYTLIGFAIVFIIFRAFEFGTDSTGFIANYLRKEAGMRPDLTKISKDQMKKALKEVIIDSGGKGKDGATIQPTEILKTLAEIDKL